MASKLLTPAQAAQLKGVSRAAVYAAIADGRLPHIIELGRLGVREADVKRWAPREYAGRPGVKGGRPKGIPVNEETKARISASQKKRWARRKKSK